MPDPGGARGGSRGGFWGSRGGFWGSPGIPDPPDPLQVRLPDGRALTQSFRAREPLAAVRLFVELQREPGNLPEAFSLRTAFPRRLFTDEDMEKPLQELGMGGWGVLEVVWGVLEWVWGAQGGFGEVHEGGWGVHEGVWGTLRGLEGSPEGFEGP